MLQSTFQPESVYHIYTHANGSENLFNCDSNYKYFLSKYSEHIYPIAETYAYCLMPNHFHLMVQMRTEREIIAYLRGKSVELSSLQGLESLGGFSMIVSRSFSNLFNGYTQAYNKMYNRKGSLFSPNFKRKEVTDESYMTQLISYIHNNPVHHGFTDTLIDWPYSSFHTYLSVKPTKLNRRYMTEWFGNKEGLIRFHKEECLPQKLRLEDEI